MGSVLYVVFFFQTFWSGMQGEQRRFASSVRSVRAQDVGDSSRWSRGHVAREGEAKMERPFECRATRLWLPRKCCLARSHVPVSVTRAFLSSVDDTLNELQRKRFQEVARELSEHVRAFVPETPLVVAKDHSIESQVITRSFSSRAQRMHVRAFMGVHG